MFLNYAVVYIIFQQSEHKFSVYRTTQNLGENRCIIYFVYMKFMVRRRYQLILEHANLFFSCIINFTIRKLQVKLKKG